MPEEFEKKMNNAFDILIGKKKEPFLVTHLIDGRSKKPLVYTDKNLPHNISFVGCFSNEKPQKHLISFKHDINVKLLIKDLNRKFRGAYWTLSNKASGETLIGRSITKKNPAFEGKILISNDTRNFLHLASIKGNEFTCEGFMPRHLLPILKIVKTRKAEREM